MIEEAYRVGETLGVAVWCHDQAGPYQTKPYPGGSWQPEGEPSRQPAEYIRDGTAKLLTLFQPTTGQVRVAGVTACPNSVLHPWLKQEVTAILAALPQPPRLAASTQRAWWTCWQAGLTDTFCLPDDLPPLRMLLVLDNLKGHKSLDLVLWLIGQGVIPLYTPLGGSWLNMAESIQRLLVRRALDGQHLETATAIIEALEAVSRSWNRTPTPFVWGGKRAVRRARCRQRRHTQGGSGACTKRPISLKDTKLRKWLKTSQVTH